MTNKTKTLAHKMFDERFGQLPDMIEIDIESFIDEIIDMAVAERDKEIGEMIDGLDRYNFAGELRAEGVAIDIRDLKNKLSAEALNIK